jgi:hypothetical protein
MKAALFCALALLKDKTEPANSSKYTRLFIKNTAKIQIVFAFFQALAIKCLQIVPHPSRSK